MIEVLRKSVILALRQPVLWLPTMLAGFVAFWIRDVQSIVVLRIIIALLPRQSLFDNSPDLSALNATTTKALPMTAPVGLMAIFLVCCLFTAAMLITGALVRSFVDNERPNLTVVTNCLSRPLLVLAFSAKVFAVFAFAGGFTWLLVNAALQYRYIIVIANGAVFLLHLGIAYLAAPLALSLLRSQSLGPAPRREKTLARVFAVLTVCGSNLIAIALTGVGGRFDPMSFLIASVAYPFIGSATPDYLRVAIRLGGSLTEAVPVVILVIALSLMNCQDRQAKEVQVPVGT